MAKNIVLTFALLYGATIALIVAIYVALIERKRKKKIYQERLIQENIEKEV